MQTSEPRIQTIVLQPTPFCNIRCKYCYLPTRDDTSVMDIETVVASFQKVFDSPYAGSQITVIWHAGEPLVLPVSYYESAFRAIEELRPSSDRDPPLLPDERNPGHEGVVRPDPPLEGGHRSQH